ncbi:glutamic acid-rich protein-like [Prunus persica]|uniref:glutamic acid-rich protein-like n=1 Tax=Prunus persica TaxID=3760 RepID=UPI0009AB6F54|nr:glutamic acid-rich protein-like [Prunus persica]
MAQRIKTKPKPNYDRKAKHPDYVQFRCNAYAFNSIIRDIKDKLNERQKKLLKKTPFWNLIELFYRQRIDMNNMNKSDIDLAQLLKTFDPDTKSFKFGTKSFQITSNAVTQILGLPNEGKSVKLVNDRYTATFRTRHFGEKGKPSKNQEVVSLILILLCMTFLFTNSSSTLHWKLFEHCVNLDTLSSYSWARAVSDYMNESLTAKAKAKAKKGGEASIGAVSGCTILILFLLCERTNIIQPILGKEKETPAILKWSLVELHTRFNQIKDLNDIEGIFKTPKKRKTTREEEDTVEKGILKTYKKRKTTGEEGDPLDKEKEKEDDEGKPDDAIQDLLVKSMTDQINYRQQQDPSFVCPERLQLWKDEKNEDSEKKMKELWDIFIQAEKRSKELEVELATYIEKLDNEECVTATMTVESTVQLNEIQNLKRRIAELEGKETGIDMEKIAKKKEIQEKYKAEIESLLSDPTIFEMEMDLPTKQPTKPVEEKEEEKKEEEKQQEEREEEKKQDAPTPDVPSRVQRLKNRERKRLQASCYVYEKNKKTKKEAKKDDEELPQFKLISSEELTQEASQPDATNPIPDPPKGTSLHDSIPVDLQQSSDEDEGQKKQTKKKLGWGQKKVWQKISKPDRERIEKHYLSTQLRDIFWAGLNDEKVTNHDLKDIVWDLELSQNVIEAYIQIEEDKIEPMRTESPHFRKYIY